MVLKARGYTNVRHIARGMFEWDRACLPVNVSGPDDLPDAVNEWEEEVRRAYAQRRGKEYSNGGEAVVVCRRN